VHFTITNEGDVLNTFIGLELVDSSGQRYSYLDEGLDFIVEEEACQIVELEPAAAATCTAVYDIPFEATGLQAVFTDLSLIGPEEKLDDLALD